MYTMDAGEMRLHFETCQDTLRDGRFSEALSMAKTHVTNYRLVTGGRSPGSSDVSTTAYDPWGMGDWTNEEEIEREYESLLDEYTLRRSFADSESHDTYEKLVEAVDLHFTRVEALIARAQRLRAARAQQVDRALAVADAYREWEREKPRKRLRFWRSHPMTFYEYWGKMYAYRHGTPTALVLEAKNWVPRQLSDDGPLTTEMGQ